MNFHEISLSKRKNLRTLVRAKTKIIALEGGSGSGKTWDVLKYLIYVCQKNKNAGIKIMVGRAFYAWIEDSILDDFKRILITLDLWTGKFSRASHPINHTLYGNTFHFRGADQESKFHGPRWDIVYLNEGMEYKHESCTQLFIRTNLKILIDWNPYLMQHWIYNKILTRDDCTHVISTFFDNPDLPEEQRKEILGFEPTHTDDRHIEDKKQRRPHLINIKNCTADDRLWSIYGEGIRMAPEGLIFKNVNYIDAWPQDVDYIYAMDFGFTVDPHAMGKVGETNREIFVEVLSYEPIDTPEAIDLYAEKIGMNKNRITIGDSSDKYTGENKGTVEMVKGLRGLGWNIRKVSKIKSIMYWINSMKLKRINFINNNLVHFAKKEAENYVLKTINDETINQPIDKFNHIWDFVKYGHIALNQSSEIRATKR